MFSGFKYMFRSMFRFFKHSTTDVAKAFKSAPTESVEGEIEPQVEVVDRNTIIRNMEVSRIVFGALLMLCVLGVVFYTDHSLLAGGHFLLLVLFFGFKFLQVSKDLTEFKEEASHGRTKERQ